MDLNLILAKLRKRKWFLRKLEKRAFDNKVGLPAKVARNHERANVSHGNGVSGFEMILFTYPT